jgi:GLPGLI family protein
MKNVKLLPALLIALICYHYSAAQSVFTDGKVSYNVKVDVPSGNQQMADMFDGSTYTLYVKGKLHRIDMNLGMLDQTILTNAGDSSMVVLMDVSGNKYLIRVNKSDMQKQQAKYSGISFTDTTGSKTIAGYQCKEAIAKLSDGTTFPVYYTTDLVPAGSITMDNMFNGLKGFPLEYEITMQRLKMTITASSVDLSPVPASLFDVPTSGYREVTSDELRQMMGGRRGNR